MIPTGTKDIDLKILSDLDDRDLLNFCISDPKNKYIKKLCENEIFWRNRLLNKFIEFKEIKKLNTRSWKDTYLMLIYYLEKYNINEIIQKISIKDKDLMEYFKKLLPKCKYCNKNAILTSYRLPRVADESTIIIKECLDCKVKYMN